ncbi:flagellar motor protein MotB [Silvibacterium acidisoli]|uniref:flagellar motor protein MotB n=1 Tax=Acidobacteriaceae bacterium ZG23-2 TaxID=2883246 RepID=UPI00406C87DA
MRRRPPKRRHNHERWLVSYADFITLMFAFFVVLYASSQADKHKQAQFAQAIDQAFKSLSVFETTGSNSQARITKSPDETAPVNIVLGDELSQPPPEAVRHDFNRMQTQLNNRLSNQIAQHVVALRIGRDGLVISLREAGFFDSGSAAPHPGAMSSIDAIVDVLRPTPYDLRIEGHTDNVPIHTEQYSSNWELSAARATVMARLFIERERFAPQRLSAAGYGEFHPVAANTSAEGRGQNRRVDIIVLPHTSATSPEMSIPR